MKDMIIRLWPAEAISSSYFGLVKKLVDACPRLDVIKRSVCIEDARLAFSYCKVWWAKLVAIKLATAGRWSARSTAHPSDTSAMS